MPRRAEVLDVAVLVPMTGMSLRDYAVQIGFGYLAIPVITLLVGKVLADAKAGPAAI